MSLTSILRPFMILGIGAMLSAALGQDSSADKNNTATPTASVSQPAAAATKSDDKATAARAPAVAGDRASSEVATTPGEEMVIHSHTDRLSYAAGVDMARDLKRQGDSHAINVDLFMKALSDTIAGRHLLMDSEEAAATMKAWEAEQKQDFQHANMMISERNRRESEAFFADNAKKEGVITLPSGLQYKILKKGDGKIPTFADIVLCNYTGKLIDGTEIDSSSKRKQPTTVAVKGVIPGWMQALQLMPVGSKWQLFIPPQLAFGEKATPIVGPNATLIFEVELLSIQDKPQTASAAGDKVQTASTAK